MQAGDEVAGRYRLVELRGQGPMSEVWRAHDSTLDRTVALKLLSPTADLERFRREARAVAALSHENVMRVFDYGEDEDRPFMALEWLPGGTLEERLARGPLPPGETQRVAEGLAAGLAHLHARGLVHRDLKPANVLFDDEDRPKLGDFGLARHAAGSGTLTDAGTVLGTAAYISPEQAAGEPAGPASDSYSFGVILFRMLTGRLPFVADDAPALVHMHRYAPPPEVQELQPDAPLALATLTAAALRKDPAERPADGEALLAALGAVPTQVDVTPDTEVTQVLTTGPTTVPTRPRRRAAVAVVALGLLALAGAGLAWTITRPPPTPAAGISSGRVAGTRKTGTSGTRSDSVPGTTQPSHHARHRRGKHPATTTSAPATTTDTTTTPVSTTLPTTTTATVPTTTPSTTTATIPTTTALPTTGATGTTRSAGRRTSRATA